MSHHPPRDESRRRRPRANGVSRASSRVDVGHEPPLNADGTRDADIDRREINLRWLGASVLTGLTGAALIGASIHVALQGGTTSPSAPERAVLTASRTPSGEERAATEVHKGDKL